MMKKQYIIPQTEIVEMNYRGILAVSGSFGGDADSPAMGRDFLEDESELEQLLNL